MSGAVAQSVEIPTRGGGKLTALVFLPAPTRQHPTLLEITPYGPHSSELQIGAADYYTSRDYAMVIQNVAGRFGSTGSFDPFRSNASDSIDVLRWIVTQPWSDGDVVTIGGSYSGLTQFAVNAPTATMLRCQHIRQAPTSPAEHVLYRGGAFELAFAMSWALENSTLETPNPSADAALGDLENWLWKLPLAPFPPLDEGSFYEKWVRNPPDSPYWSPSKASRIRYDLFAAPILHLGGWYDPFLEGTIEAYERLAARTEDARPRQRLLIGPWTHGSEQIGRTHVGEVDFGPDAYLDSLGSKLEWIDPWLQGGSGPTDGSPPVRLFVTGINRWWDFDEWPPGSCRETSFYLSPETSGTATSLNDGSLRPMASDKEADPPTQYEYDPDKPVITNGGATVHFLDPGPRDMRETERHCTTFTSTVLNESLTVIGSVHVSLYAHSTCADTDFVARLTDVSPSGDSIFITEGVLRARYRHSINQPVLLRGEIEQYQIQLSATAHVFRRGHRLRLAVTSSNFPRWSRNLNTGDDNHTSTRRVTAVNSIYHDRSHPSRISVPILREHT